jgi:hypothetical protein
MAAFPSSALATGACSFSASAASSALAWSAPRPARNADLFSGVEDVRRLLQLGLLRNRHAVGGHHGDVMLHIASRARIGLERHGLHVDRHGHVRHASPGERGSAGELHHVLHMRWPHDARVVDADIGEQLVELDILLGMGVNQVVKLQAGDRQHRGTVELGVVESVEEMNPARPGGCKTDAELAGELGIGTGHEGSRFLVPHLDKADIPLPLAQRLHDAVDAIAR